MTALKGKKGIDVSTFQKTIDWSKVKGHVDFAIIRGGFGRNNADDQAINNFKGCTAQKIPFGIYWFSYALSAADSAKEADYACDMADKYKLTLPVVGYDWEEDSEDYAKKHGVKMTDAMRLQFAKAFCDRVKARGYIPLLYINYSDLDIGFDKLAKTYDVWFANPGGSKPDVSNLTFWQYSWTGKVPGITYGGESIDVDMNICYKDFGKAGGDPPSSSASAASKPSPSSAAQPTSCTLRFAYLGRGWDSNTADQVRTVQRLLKSLGYKGKDGKALDVDGAFGVNTEYAVKAYQKAKKADADGVVGVVTWKLLTGAE